MSKQIPRSQDIPQATRQALVWLRNYVDTAVAAGVGSGSGVAVLDGGDSSTASFSSYVDGGSA